MNNEEYIEKLINEIKQFNNYLEIRAEILPNEEFCGRTVESATLDEIDKLKKHFNPKEKNFILYDKKDIYVMNIFHVHKYLFI